jgi:hypothetical protein
MGAGRGLLRLWSGERDYEPVALRGESHTERIHDDDGLVCRLSDLASPPVRRRAARREERKVCVKGSH